MKRNILITDDEKNTREGLKLALENKDYRIFLARDGQETLSISRRNILDLLITDLKMPGMDGMELLQRMKRESPSTEVIILTGHGTVGSAVKAMKEGAYDYLLKPVNLDELNLMVDRVLMYKSMKEENKELREQVSLRYGFDNIIGRSTGMEKIFNKIRQIAPTKTTVLIQGESGTGKELIASSIHYNSPRRNKPFVRINCGALTPTLLESELFGHEKGAFTNAFNQRKGRFELADGGTIFLDEISETSPDFQVKLLRVLQEQEFERVGGVENVKVDVRVITATNKKLEELMKKGAFREDLFYRLNVIQITIPPLRERTEDIPLLTNAFVEELCREHKRPHLEITQKGLTMLQNYHWPGNVRQLRNVIEGLVVTAPSKKIYPKHLPEQIREAADKGTIVNLKVGTSMRDAEKAIIKATLLQVDGNKSKAAELLGLGRKTLYRKIEEYEIE